MTAPQRHLFSLSISSRFCLYLSLFLSLPLSLSPSVCVANLATRPSQTLARTTTIAQIKPKALAVLFPYQTHPRHWHFEAAAISASLLLAPVTSLLSLGITALASRSTLLLYVLVPFLSIIERVCFMASTTWLIAHHERSRRRRSIRQQPCAAWAYLAGWGLKPPSS